MLITLRVLGAALLLVTKGRRYGPGPQLKMLYEALHVTTNFLILNLWSFAGDADRANVNAKRVFLNVNIS
jgi:hypothetical protein